jgi:hypothetical protein
MVYCLWSIIQVRGLTPNTLRICPRNRGLKANAFVLLSDVMKTCEEYQDLLMRRLDSALNLTEQATLDAHLRDCPRCRLDYEYLRAADGLLRAVDAPPVSGQDWAAVFAGIAKESAADETLRVAAGATDPPAVTGDEWATVWDNIERGALLGEKENVTPIEIAPAARRRAGWRRYATAVAAAAVIALGVFIVIDLLQPPPPKPDMPADIVEVGEGYAYTTIRTTDNEPIYVISDVNNLDYVSAVTEGDFMYSERDGHVIEVAPREDVEGPPEGPVVVPPGP